VTRNDAWKLANHWVAAWNAHDLDLIMTHYTNQKGTRTAEFTELSAAGGASGGELQRLAKLVMGDWAILICAFVACRG